jgi:opacity protein-like surface antigen
LKKLLVAAAIVAAFAVPAQATEWVGPKSMICKNPRREYVVEWNGFGTVVLYAENDASVFKGKDTGLGIIDTQPNNDGIKLQLSFGNDGNKLINYFMAGDHHVFQQDRCR